MTSPRFFRLMITFSDKPNNTARWYQESHFLCSQSSKWRTWFYLLDYSVCLILSGGEIRWEKKMKNLPISIDLLLLKTRRLVWQLSYFQLCIKFLNNSSTLECMITVKNMCREDAWGGSLMRGSTCTPLHNSYLPFQTMQICWSGDLRRQQTWQRTYKACHLPQNTETFLANFCVSWCAVLHIVST